MGRDVQDWTIIDAQPNQPVIPGIGWARQSPAGHEFIPMTWRQWDELGVAASKGNVPLFESLLANQKDAWQMYSQASGESKRAIRDCFAAVRRR